MQTIKIQKDSNSEVIECNEVNLSNLLTPEYPEWAATALAALLMNDESRDTDENTIINIDIEKQQYKIIDANEAASESGVGAFDLDTYAQDDEDDEDYAIDEWLDEIELQLVGQVSSNRDGMESEFLIKNL